MTGRSSALWYRIGWAAVCQDGRGLFKNCMPTTLEFLRKELSEEWGLGLTKKAEDNDERYKAINPITTTVIISSGSKGCCYRAGAGNPLLLAAASNPFAYEKSKCLRPSYSSVLVLAPISLSLSRSALPRRSPPLAAWNRTREAPLPTCKLNNDR